MKYMSPNYINVYDNKYILLSSNKGIVDKYDINSFSQAPVKEIMDIN